MAPTRQPVDIGSRVRLRLLKNETLFHTTRVEEITDRWLAVLRPTHNYVPVRLYAGTEVELQVVRTVPPEGIYRAETVVLGESRRPVPLVRLRLPEQWERAQLREYFRVSAVRPVRARLLPAEDGTPWIEGMTRDISGGGAQIVLPQAVGEGQRLELELDLPDSIQRVLAVVRRAQTDPDLGPGMTVVGVKFENMPERQREEIIRYAFERQIELRRKGAT